MAVGKASFVVEGSVDPSVEQAAIKVETRSKQMADAVARDQERVRMGMGGASGGHGLAPEDNSIFANMARTAKEAQRDKSAMGLNAMARLGPSGLAMQYMGIGMQGVAVDMIGKSFGNITGGLRDLAEGKKNAGEMMRSIATGLPVLGGFVKGWVDIGAMISGSAKAAAELNKHIESIGRTTAVVQSLQSDMQENRISETVGKSQTFARLEADRKNKLKAISDEGVEIQKQRGEAMGKAGMSGIVDWAFGVTDNITFGQWKSVNEEWQQRLMANANKAAKEFDDPLNANKNRKLEAERHALTLRNSLFRENALESRHSMAELRLGRSIAEGGNPEEVLRRRQNLARLNLNARLGTMDAEINQNEEDAKKGDLHGLTKGQWNIRQKALKDQMAEAEKAGQTEITRMATDEGNRRRQSLLGIEQSINRGRIGIMMTGAKTSEEQMKAQHAAITQRMEEDVAALQEKAKDPSIGAEEKERLAEQEKVVRSQAQAESEKLDREENKRRSFSLLDIEKSIARNRLSVMQSGARDSAAIWKVTEAQIRQETQDRLDETDRKLKDINLSETERNKLLKERESIQEAGNAQLERAAEDHRREQRSGQRSVSLGLIGVSQNLLTNAQNQFGGNNPEAIKMQKRLGIMGQSLSMHQQIEGIINDPNATKEQKDAAQLASKSLANWQSYALSEKNLNKTPYQPLRFAEAEEASRGYSGMAAYQREADENAYAKENDTREEQKRTNELLSAIVEMMKSDSRGGNALFPNG
ncbi:MAG: hypothetical protein FWD61_11980 [Phycisphaerales bacterium]|nr:hypothetical protein [Phycisphaerales bacterium]